MTLWSPNCIVDQFTGLCSLFTLIALCTHASTVITVGMRHRALAFFGADLPVYGNFLDVGWLTTEEAQPVVVRHRGCVKQGDQHKDSSHTNRYALHVDGYRLYGHRQQAGAAGVQGNIGAVRYREGMGSGRQVKGEVMGCIAAQTMPD